VLSRSRPIARLSVPSLRAIIVRARGNTSDWMRRIIICCALGQDGTPTFGMVDLRLGRAAAPCRRTQKGSSTLSSTCEDTPAAVWQGRTPLGRMRDDGRRRGDTADFLPVLTISR
jgi:hypothetical protein